MDAPCAEVIGCSDLGSTVNWDAIAAVGTIAAVFVALGFALRDSVDRKRQTKAQRELAAIRLVPHLRACAGETMLLTAPILAADPGAIEPEKAKNIVAKAADIHSTATWLEDLSYKADPETALGVAKVLAYLWMLHITLERAADNMEYSPDLIHYGPQIHHLATTANSLVTPLLEKCEAELVKLTGVQLWKST